MAYYHTQTKKQRSEHAKKMVASRIKKFKERKKRIEVDWPKLKFALTGVFPKSNSDYIINEIERIFLQ